MAEIGAKLVASLRKATGAGMMDCKRALEEVEGDLEKAMDWLRVKGLGKAGKLTVDAHDRARMCFTSAGIYRIKLENTPYSGGFVLVDSAF